ncbi:Choline/ethanolaminephosphotransferase 1 [Pseudolycoriella hygida]|uniref:diacylglycerol cholinephosphotransferase n=1 Tax=Pseudolycoriella hygida TaxID=35572 RepID=A0A9Q0N8U8_9DIPT|nr:Choline/ethanolaminephosphotransferase 1 [Pseudolycoriella hygida]
MSHIRNMFLYKNKLLSGVQLKKLSEHKYACTNVSILDPILQPWWCFLVSKVPLWLAPNLLTITGLFINVLTTLILVFYSPNAREEPPRWASALCALGLFIYQSLDAIDGKQARRTNSSNPLGELFDHGCDSISTVFVALSACISVRLGFYPKWMFFQCFCAMTLFYCAHWQTYVSGTLRFGKVDVTEAQCTIMAIHMISAIFGPNIWMSKLPLFGHCSLVPCAIFFFGYLQCFVAFIQIFIDGGCGKNGSTVALPFGNMDVKTFPLYFAVVISGFLAFENASIIFTGGVGKNGSTVAGTSVISPILPFLAVVLPAFIISEKSIDGIFEKYTSLYILAFGMVAAKVTNKLVIAHMTKSEMGYLDAGLIGPLLLFLNQYFNSFFSEYCVLWIAMIWCTWDLMRYCSQVCLEICEHLNIQLFRIPYPPRLPTNPTTTAPVTSSNNTSDRNGLSAKRQTRSSKRH